MRAGGIYCNYVVAADEDVLVAAGLGTDAVNQGSRPDYNDRLLGLTKV